MPCSSSWLWHRQRSAAQWQTSMTFTVGYLPRSNVADWSKMWLPVPDGAMVGGVEPVVVASDGGFRQDGRCDKSFQYDKFGCSKGLCWANCNVFAVLYGEGEWCYTTHSYSQSRQYIPCSVHEDCDPCWTCGGPCSLFWVFMNLLIWTSRLIK